MLGIDFSLSILYIIDTKAFDYFSVFIVFKNCATYLVVSVRPNSVSFSSREEIIKFVFNGQADFFV